MDIIAGIDLHSNNAVCALMDQSSRRLLQKRLPNHLPEILQVLEPCPSFGVRSVPLLWGQI